MTTLRQAAEMALTEIANARDYIWLLNEGGIGVSEKEMLEKMAKTITDIRAALAEQTVASDYQDSHQPVGWMVYTLDGKSAFVTDNPKDFTQDHRALPLYTHPPQHNPLTNEEILKAWKPFEGNPFTTKYEFARAVERAHGIGGE